MRGMLAGSLIALLASTAFGQDLRMGVQSAFVVDPHVLFLGPNMAMARNLYDSLVGRDAAARAG